MSNTGKNFLILAALVAAGSLGTNALLWSRYTPDRPMLRFGDGNAVTRGAYQNALESADASGDILSRLLKDSKGNAFAPGVGTGNAGQGDLRTVSGNADTFAGGLTGLKGKILQVADVDMPMPRRVRRAKPRKRIVPRRRVARTRITKKPTQRVAGVSLRPNAKPPVSAMDSSRVAGRLRPTAPLLPGNNVSGAAPLSFAGPGAVEPSGVIAGFPSSAPGATVFSQVGSGVPIGGIGGGSNILGGIAPYLVGGTAIVGAVVANNNGGTGGTSTGGTATGGTATGGTTGSTTTTGGTTTGSTTGTTGGDDVPPIPEPAPVALATALMIGVAGLMVRARRKMSEA